MPTVTAQEPTKAPRQPRPPMKSGGGIRSMPVCGGARAHPRAFFGGQWRGAQEPFNLGVLRRAHLAAKAACARAIGPGRGKIAVQCATLAADAVCNLSQGHDAHPGITLSA